MKVRDHDFPDKDTVRIVPYGIYDIAANTGFVSVGTSGDTAAFAAGAIGRWWRDEGSLRYPGARRLLVTCDCGGSNGYRCRLWKDRLAVLAAETGLVIEVCHFPPGTSKWNKIEHRLFCHITRTWKARPLGSVEDAVAGIAATVTSQGLKCTAVTDTAEYPGGTEVSDERMRYLEDRVITRDEFRGEWNYAVAPAPRPASRPGPGPGPSRPGRVPARVLNHAALTGMQPEDLDALAQALENPAAARRDHDNRLRRGRPRANAIRRGGGSSGHRRLSLTDCLLALRLRQHLSLPHRAIAALLGADPTTISKIITLASSLLATAPGPRPPAASPPARTPATPAELLAYAAASGISLTLPENGHPMPQQFKPRKPPLTTTRPKPPPK